MLMFRPVASCIALLFAATVLRAQHDKYHAPSDPQVLDKIAAWQDLKFGLFMHWGPYSQWGIVESWSICPEDEGWTQRRGPHSKNYFDYVKAYEKLQTTFNPVQFAPEKWVQAAKAAGMKYMVFTTKHHDGFAMFDTKESDYKITDSKTPFSGNPRSNVTKEIFDVFRKENFWIGAYFSKPDWHNENYWWPYFPPKDRNVNYEVTKYPDRWNAFKNFTYNQVQELMTQYGKMDILWLDGGWVRPLATVDTSVEWQRGIKIDQDIDMKRIADMARSHHPGMLVVDRTVTGEYENYTTPEQQVPDKPLSYPWETCMTMGDSWSYVPNDNYKSSRQLIHLLIKIVSRGGNFLLNVGPGPHGDWDPVVYQRLQDISEWMKLNNSGIYSSKPIAPYSDRNVYFTQSKDGKITYAYYLVENDDVALPAQLTLQGVVAEKGSTITAAGSSTKLHWKIAEGNTVITIPAAVAAKVKNAYAVLFTIKKK
mgnify:CR=1 FL=1